MRYVDTGSRDPEHSLFSWLKQVLPDATFFACQTGYFSYDAIFPLEGEFHAILARMAPLHLVVGANKLGVREEDLSDVLDLFDKHPKNSSKSLTLVAADDILMHPKTYYVETSDGTRHALVGSANFTHAGLGRNIEAALIIDSSSDPGAPFAEIRASIEKWHVLRQVNGHQVTRTSLSQLVATGVLDRPSLSRSVERPETRRARAKAFPGLGAMLKLPRKNRPIAPSTPAARPHALAPISREVLDTMPGGAVGIIKRLTSHDTKGFREKDGTLYIALTNVLTAHLPMAPYGQNGEPRMDVTVAARLDTVPGEVVLSGKSPTNITHVGTGATRNSHGDLRFNYLMKIKRGISTLAADYGVRPPTEGDLTAIEFLEGQRVRVTFITEQGAINNLTPLLDQRGDGWGWLPPAAIGPWPHDEP